ncbi:uncharacterized protein [Rutidosis leptorrhynchoides]|uniref:uncharacterized protein n=1 Tax=Rutidosis leptorrhynchoides TaxID=125765 RepID=UPI003A99AF47
MMNSYDFIDTVNAEKVNAIARYKQFTNITKLFQLLEVFVAIVLILWTSTRIPTVFKFSGEYLFAFSSYLMNQHVVFIFGNVIIVVCYVLSRYSESGTESAGSFGSHSDNGLTFRKPTGSPTPSSEIHNRIISIPDPVASEKLIIKTESEVTALFPVIKQTESEVTAVFPVITEAAKQIERFQRTQSELRSKISVKPRRELRRSVTEMKRSVTVKDGESPAPLKAVERLSNEEFKVAVEAFILKQQKFLKQQSMVED